ncbi:MAG TPA: serine hydrolase domain-containing protein [Ignavibacteriaceae bacterium]|nr:serine hydrolase domain-containing protein [Ignavibacteriaceae bacterium]
MIWLNLSVIIHIDKMILKRNLFLFVSALVLVSCINAQEKQDKSFNFSLVDELVNTAISEKVFPGASLLIWQNGKVIHRNFFGTFTYNSDAQVITDKSIFDLASLTKVIVTTTAAMICIDRGLFSLDDKVVKFVPEFGANGKENITIRNLLLHNSGLVAWRKFYGRGLDEFSVIKEIYESSLEFETGTKTVYSDLGIITLGKIIEIVTGLKLDEFSEKEIFTPLNMISTFYNPLDSLKRLCAPTEQDNYWRNKLLQGEVHDETAAMLGGIAGHAGLFSTTDDLAKFMTMIMNKGIYENKKILDNRTLEMFTKKQTNQSSRGLGWDTKSEKGSSAGDLFSANSFGHTGFTGTSIWADPERNLFVVFLTNRVYPSRDNTKIISFRPKLHNEVINSISE